ncbi:hypothetical protein C8R43DRAFT_1132618 [Mycena crocata]|nr:hypothetical protein C8R43DRAFT_1132618 [Mycena crocata]
MKSFPCPFPRRFSPPRASPIEYHPPLHRTRHLTRFPAFLDALDTPSRGYSQPLSPPAGTPSPRHPSSRLAVPHIRPPRFPPRRRPRRAQESDRRDRMVVLFRQLDLENTLPPIPCRPRRPRPAAAPRQVRPFLPPPSVSMPPSIKTAVRRRAQRCLDEGPPGLSRRQATPRRFSVAPASRRRPLPLLLSTIPPFLSTPSPVDIAVPLIRELNGLVDEQSSYDAASPPPPTLPPRYPRLPSLLPCWRGHDDDDDLFTTTTTDLHFEGPRREDQEVRPTGDAWPSRTPRKTPARGWTRFDSEASAEQLRMEVSLVSWCPGRGCSVVVVPARSSATPLLDVATTPTRHDARTHPRAHAPTPTRHRRPHGNTSSAIPSLPATLASRPALVPCRGLFIGFGVIFWRRCLFASEPRPPAPTPARHRDTHLPPLHLNATPPAHRRSSPVVVIYSTDLLFIRLGPTPTRTHARTQRRAHKPTPSRHRDTTSPLSCPPPRTARDTAPPLLSAPAVVYLFVRVVFLGWDIYWRVIYLLRIDHVHPHRRPHGTHARTHPLPQGTKHILSRFGEDGEVWIRT